MENSLSLKFEYFTKQITTPRARARSELSLFLFGFITRPYLFIQNIRNNTIYHQLSRKQYTTERLNHA